MHETTFDQLGLIEPILKALQHEGYTTPTPIQAQSIPFLLEGRDLLGCAQTGTGKTAAFAIPMLQRMYNAGGGTARGGRRPIRALILTPTRELAIQIDESYKAYGRFTGLRAAVIFGGVGQKPQTDALRAGIDILVATPGRLLDLMNQGFVNLKELEYFVLDEADRMLDMGFIHDVKKVIAAIPKKRQTLFFSATMPPEVQRLSSTLLFNPVKVEVTPASSTAETVEQEVFFVDKGNKANLLVHLLETRNIKQALVFSRTKHGADKLVRIVEKAGISAEAIHGNKAQNARQRALKNFKDHKTRVLVATDIAARGIDIDSLSHVVNFDIPNVPETYVHRIGRTGRAGASGIALSLCDVDERVFLRDITKLIARQIPINETHPFPASGNASKPLPPASPKGQGRNGGGRNGGGRGQSQGQGQASGQPKDFASLTAELINDLDGGGTGAGAKPKQTPPTGGERNSRRRWRGPRPSGGGKR